MSAGHADDERQGPGIERQAACRINPHQTQVFFLPATDIAGFLAPESAVADTFSLTFLGFLASLFPR